MIFTYQLKMVKTFLFWLFENIIRHFHSFPRQNFKNNNVVTFDISTDSDYLRGPVQQGVTFLCDRSSSKAASVAHLVWHDFLCACTLPAVRQPSIVKFLAQAVQILSPQGNSQMVDQ